MKDQETIRLLLVEDSPLDFFLFRALLSTLKETKFELLHVERLSEAIAVLREQEVDVIFTDLNLPDANGAETVQGLVSHGKEVPVIILSGYADGDAETGLLSEGVSGLLSKDGLTAGILSQAIDEALQRRRAERS
jgi:DNA-binding NarL/FixJ family response regulator